VTIFIHGGGHKTGSSIVQRLFNSDPFESCPYINTARIEEDPAKNANNAAFDFLFEKGDTASAIEVARPIDTAIAEASGRADKCFLSTEKFELAFEGTGSRVRRFHDWIDHIESKTRHDVQFIFLFRRADYLLNSIYVQRCRGGLAEGSFAEFVEDFRQFPRLKTLPKLQRIRDVFLTDAKIVPYMRDVDHDFDVVQVVMEILDINEEVEPPRDVNINPGAYAIAWHRVLTRALKLREQKIRAPLRDRNEFGRALDRFLRDIGKSGARFWGFNPDQHAEVLEYFYPDHCVIARDYMKSETAREFFRDTRPSVQTCSENDPGVIFAASETQDMLDMFLQHCKDADMPDDVIETARTAAREAARA
jgi:hypothetical protein